LSKSARVLPPRWPAYGANSTSLAFTAAGATPVRVTANDACALSEYL
jgi:hypothetical protein